MRVPISAPALLVLCSIAGACEDSRATLTATLNGPSPAPASRLTVEPARLAPIFAGSPSCSARPPFHLRFHLFVHADRGLVLRRLGFELADEAGGRTLPVPIPGTLPFHGVALSPGVHELPVGLSFGCGVPPRGTLIIDADATDRDGRPDSARLRVVVGG